MTELRVKTAIEYFGSTDKTVGYIHSIPDALPVAHGVIFRSNTIINEDGSFDVTLVPWENVVSFTHAMSPPGPNEKEQRLIELLETIRDGCLHEENKNETYFSAKKALNLLFDEDENADE